MYAKTLFLPDKPKHVEEELKKFSKMKLPYFFQYAKDKELKQVDELNDSTVNKLHSIIPDKSIQFKKVAGECDYRLLMNNERVIVNDEIVDTFTRINRNKRFFINKNEFNNDGFNKFVKSELNKISTSDSYISDCLVKKMFEANTVNKETLWACYGEQMYENLLLKLGDTICCEECNDRFEAKKNEKLCASCKKEKKKEQNRLADKKYREKLKR